VSNLNTRWTKGLQGEKKEGLEKLVRNSHIVLSRLKTILEEDLEFFQKVVETDYDSPSWHFRQAHLNGKQDYARQMLRLLEFLERK
jgi:hypothetical protein